MVRILLWWVTTEELLPAASICVGDHLGTAVGLRIAGHPGNEGWYGSHMAGLMYSQATVSPSTYV